MHEKKFPHFSPLALPFHGAYFFLSNPSLWWRALAWTIISFLALGTIFVSLLVWLWPTAVGSSLHYWIDSGTAIGYSFLATLVLWLFVFPIPTAVFYERMLKKVLQLYKADVQHERFLQGITSSLRVLRGTFLQRIFWTLFPLFFLFIFPPFFTLFSFIGMGYITLIDAVDLSLSIQGIPSKERLLFIRKERLSLLTGGLISGIFMALFLFTLIGFVFLIPSLYVGALLWVRKT